MLRLNGKLVEVKHFPDGTILLKEDVAELAKENKMPVIRWHYESNEELVALYFLTCHLKAHQVENITLEMPYIPNARQDRVKDAGDVFTLKYFAQMINSLGFYKVKVLDAHSNVSLALIDRVELIEPKPYIEMVIQELKEKLGQEPLMFYPDEGAGKRYSGMIPLPYCFGIKNRDWKTRKIKSLSVSGETERIAGSTVLIVDDICSYGGTFLHAANKLHQLGAKNIYVFISHCENSILKGEMIQNPYVTHIYTTDSIFFSKEEEKITVFPLNW